MADQTRIARTDLVAIAMGFGFALMWSSAFTSARIIVADAPPLLALSVRFLISGLIGLGLARLMGQSWHLTPAQWRATILFGLAQNALYLGLNFVAMQTIEASLAAIIASTMPLLVALAGWAVLRERLRPLAGLGLVVGFVGVAIIMGARLGNAVDLFGLGLCVLGVISLTVATLSMRGASGAGANLMTIVGMQMLVGSAVLALPALIFEEWEVNWSWSLAAAFSYTVFVPGLAATWVWFLLVARIGAVRAATFHFLNPFFGVAVAALLLGEGLGPFDVLGVVVIMAGILAVQRARI